MSIKETVLRYEGPPRISNKHRLAQLARLEDDEAMAGKVGVTDQENRINEIAKWSEKLEEKVGYHRAKNAIKQSTAEVNQAAKATIMVRRRALENQIQKEMAQYDTELMSQGKTFHTQRI